MHKRLINELILTLRITPDGPLLIKAGDQGGVDPTRPDMEFVRTQHNGRETVYLPGSSLKGVLRAHCEKIARTVASASSVAVMERRLTCNPLITDANAVEGGCGEKFSRERKKPTAEEAFRRSCFVCQLFGNTELASHVRVSDAYPINLTEAGDPNNTERRYGVAIDRVFGSVAVGPFEFETVTQGCFEAQIVVRNFTAAQLGLLGLALRDLRMQRVAIGFAKSRGMGRIKAEIGTATLRYPLGDLLPGLKSVGQVAGVGHILYQLDATAASQYGYRQSDVAEVPNFALVDDGWGGLTQAYEGDQALDEVWKAGVTAWRAVVQQGRIANGQASNG
jgi:CRISPR-associated RAMP protein (TIGR02581 family)